MFKFCVHNLVRISALSYSSAPARIIGVARAARDFCLLGKIAKNAISDHIRARHIVLANDAALLVTVASSFSLLFSGAASSCVSLFDACYWCYSSSKRGLFIVCLFRGFLGGFSRFFSIRSPKGAKVCKSCRSRKTLKNEYLVAKFGFDTAENEPSRVLTCLPASPPLPTQAPMPRFYKAL